MPPPRNSPLRLALLIVGAYAYATLALITFLWLACWLWSWTFGYYSQQHWNDWQYSLLPPENHTTYHTKAITAENGLIAISWTAYLLVKPGAPDPPFLNFPFSSAEPSRPPSPGELLREYRGATTLGFFTDHKVEPLTLGGPLDQMNPAGPHYSFAHDDRCFIFPFWPGFALALPILLFPVIPLLRWRRAHRRISQGLCPKCAYDVRATKDRCPECGHPIPASTTAPTLEKTP